MTDCSVHTHLHAVHLRAAAATVAFAAAVAHPAVDVGFALLAALARPVPLSVGHSIMHEQQRYATLS